ncbi:hemerythrin HHE cation binding domain protein [Hydrogenophaga sp. RAC07]|uniref:bacteriohemerythrin n=1 Tax=Hydrogenophaga sp. RAC07 TaxID=1842537 RepID=UPI00085834C3|nr:hemerythrin domain-containing protein [Hydrogenophaga sp. RAC07]AOF88133.1 hemerythrin HHE cation binding domain protein [Hydrogenophaga sp. RAC07]
MQTLQWTPALWLGFDPMDAMNREFVELLGRAQAAPDDEVVATWQALVQHAATHFGAEDRWMRQETFATTEQHTLEHRVVLNLLREGLGQAQRGDLAPVRQMAAELGAWFSRHTQSLDAALALHMRRVTTSGTAAA